MNTYVIIGIVLFALIMFLRGYKSLDKLQDEATALLAYAKHAAEQKSAFFDKDKTDEEFYEEKFIDVQNACFLLIRFSEKVQGKRSDYRFLIRENGPMLGKDVTVTVGQFMPVVKSIMTKAVNSMPMAYQSRLKDYLNQPYSPENMRLSKEIEERMWPKEPPFKKDLAARRHRIIIERDYFITLFS